MPCIEFHIRIDTKSGNSNLPLLKKQQPSITLFYLSQMIRGSSALKTGDLAEYTTFNAGHSMRAGIYRESAAIFN